MARRIKVGKRQRGKARQRIRQWPLCGLLTDPARELPAQSHGLRAHALLALIEARPLTGRTHQIRIHLSESGCPCLGDELYGKPERGVELGLRAVRLAYQDPFTRKRIAIEAPTDAFCREYGFDIWPG